MEGHARAAHPFALSEPPRATPSDRIATASILNRSCELRHRFSAPVQACA
jgi:hypothetical protein